MWVPIAYSDSGTICTCTPKILFLSLSTQICMGVDEHRVAQNDLDKNHFRIMLSNHRHPTYCVFFLCHVRHIDSPNQYADATGTRFLDSGDNDHLCFWLLGLDAILSHFKPCFWCFGAFYIIAWNTMVEVDGPTLQSPRSWHETINSRLKHWWILP